MASEYRISSANHARRTFASPKTRSNKGARNLISSSVSLTSNTQIDGTLSPVMALLVIAVQQHDGVALFPPPRRPSRCRDPPPLLLIRKCRRDRARFHAKLC